MTICRFGRVTDPDRQNRWQNQQIVGWLCMGIRHDLIGLIEIHSWEGWQKTKFVPGSNDQWQKVQAAYRMYILVNHLQRVLLVSIPTHHDDPIRVTRVCLRLIQDGSNRWIWIKQETTKHLPIFLMNMQIALFSLCFHSTPYICIYIYIILYTWYYLIIYICIYI